MKKDKKTYKFDKEVTKLSVFDFDGTLVDTPLPEEGKPIWEEATGQKWPHVGWWSKIESLDMSIFTMSTIQYVIDSYETERKDENNLVVMLTGRRAKKPLEEAVKKILDALNLTFDMYLHNYGGETSANKIEQMAYILKENPTIKSVEMWDDRTEHIEIFKNWGNGLVSNGILDDFKINHIINDHFTP